MGKAIFDFIWRVLEINPPFGYSVVGVILTVLVVVIMVIIYALAFGSDD